MAKCNRCGWCCKNVNINIAFSDILRWAKERRFDILCSISYVDHEDSRRKGFYITDTVTAPKKQCPFFNRGTCSIYDTRPRACAEWPQSLTNEQCGKIECPALTEQRISEDENYEVRKWQSLDFAIAETRREEVTAILAKAREAEALSQEVFQFGLDPTESLEVTGFDNSKAGWTGVGASPYLDAQDQPANYVWTTTKKAETGDYSFENTARPNTDTLLGVDLYVYGQTQSSDTIYLWNGGGWTDTLIGGLPAAWGWINVAVDAIIDTWAKVDGALMYIAHFNSTNRSDVDAAYLLVEYTPVHLGVAALSGTGTLTAIGTVVGGVVTGIAALSGTGALEAVGDVTTYGIAALSGTGDLTAVGTVVTAGVAALSGTGALSAIGTITKLGIAALSGTGSLSAIGAVTTAGIAALSGTGTLSVVGSVTTTGVAALSGTGALSAIGQRTIFGVAALSGTGSLSAIGTVGGVVTGVAALSGTGTLTATGLVTKFGIAALSGAGDLSVAGTVVKLGIGALAGTGDLSAIGAITKFGITSLSGTGSLEAIGTVTKYAVATLSGTGALSAVGTVSGEVQGVATLSGAGALSAIGLLEAKGATVLSGTGDLSAQGLLLAQGAAALSGTGNLSAIGDVGGIVQGVANLSGTGNLSAAGLLLAQGNANLIGLGTLTAIGDVAAPITGNATLAGIGTLSAACSILAMGVAILVGSGTLTASGEVPSAAMPPGEVWSTHRIWNIDNKPRRQRRPRGGFAVWKG